MHGKLSQAACVAVITTHLGSRDCILQAVQIEQLAVAVDQISGEGDLLTVDFGDVGHRPGSALGPRGELRQNRPDLRKKLRRDPLPGSVLRLSQTAPWKSRFFGQKLKSPKNHFKRVFGQKPKNVQKWPLVVPVAISRCCLGSSFPAGDSLPQYPPLPTCEHIGSFVWYVMGSVEVP